MEIFTKPCSPSNYGGKRAETAYIVVHYTSNRGDTAENNAAYFARETVGASAHYFVDEHAVWASVPAEHVAWHCGAKTYRHAHCRNTNSIGVEVCMNDAKGRLRRGSIERAISLVRWLMRKYDIPADHVIRHYDVTGKHCPGPMVDDPALWRAFLDKLQQEDDEMQVYKHTADMPAWARDTFVRLIQAGVVSVDDKGEIAVQACSVQPMVYLDRLCGGHVERLPQAVRALGEADAGGAGHIMQRFMKVE